MKDTFTINAIMEDDMFSFMKKNHYYEAMVRGYLKCPCGEKITEDNLTAMKKIDGKIVFYHNIICATETAPSTREKIL